MTSTVTVHDWGNDTELADLMGEGDYSGRVDASGQDPTNEDGTVNVTVHRLHPDADKLTPYNVLRLVGSDTEPRMAGFITSVRDRPVAPGGQPGELIEVEATGLMGLLGEAVVLPWVGAGKLPFTGERVFNWGSPGRVWDDPSAGQVFEQSRIGYRSALGFEYPLGWPYGQAEYIWSRADSETQPDGACIFATKLTVASTANLVFLQSGDNDFLTYLAGARFHSSPPRGPQYTWWEPHQSPIQLQPGTYDVVTLCNQWPTILEVNPAGWLLAVATTDGSVLTGLVHYSEASSAWRCLDYPDPLPGFTFPEAFQILLTEAQDRGALPGWTLNVHGTHEEIPEQVYREGSTLRDVLRVGTETWVDAWADTEGLVLHLAPKSEGGRTQASALELERGVNITSLSRTVSV